MAVFAGAAVVVLASPAVGLAQDDDAPAEPSAPPVEALLENAEEAGEDAPSLTGHRLVRNPAFPALSELPGEVGPGKAFSVQDLALYFDDGPMADAAAAFEAGRFSKARQLLAGAGDAPPVRYLRALSALRAGDSKSAADEFQALAETYAALRDRCWVHAAVAAEDLRQDARAAELFARVPATSKLYVDARFGLARALRRLKDVAGAASALEPVALRKAPMWGRDVAAEALWMMAELARSLRDTRAERVALVELWARHPLSPLADQTLRRLGPRERLPVEAWVAHGETLIEAHRNQEGLKVLEPLLKTLTLPDPLACTAHFAYGKGLRKQREHTRAIQVLKPVVQQCTEPDLRVRAMYVLGTSRSIVDLEGAPETYEALAAEFSDHSFADDALYSAADVYLKTGKTDRALERIQELVRRYPKGDFAAEALFKAFWMHRTAEAWKPALAVLDQLEAQFADADESYEVERARYWRARIAEDRGAVKDAVSLLEKLSTEHPATYYGLMARQRLGRLAPQKAERVAQGIAFPAPSSPWPMHAGPMGSDPHFLAGVELLRMGFKDSAASELLAVRRSGLPQEALRLLVHAMSAAGDTRAAHAVARSALRRDLSGAPAAQTIPVWQIAYPPAFRDLIEKHCRAYGVDPHLLQALMREESALDPSALSWAGALGLTQLMPGTARRVAAMIKLRGVTTKKLLQPDVNIQLGAALLGHLLKRYQGVEQFALASYNAGETPVNRWRGQRPDEEIDVWVENIPLAETRGYVKRVLRSYNAYRLLYPTTERPPERVAGAP